MKGKRVFILGSGDSGFDISPVLRTGDEIWGINNLYTMYQLPWTRWFEIHPLTLKQGTWLRKDQEVFRGLRIDDYIFALNNLAVPVYTQLLTPNPFTNACPLDLAHFGTRYRKFFSTTLSYELALALDEGFSEIHLVGIDMILSQEYRDQRPSVAYFIGLAEGRGVTVTVSKGSPLVENDYFYGLSESSFTLWEKRVSKMRSYMDAEITKHHDMLEQYKGAQNCLQTMEEFYTTLVRRLP